MKAHEEQSKHSTTATDEQLEGTPSFLVMGMSTFKGLPQRDQQLAIALAKEGCRVDYIEIPVSMAYRVQAFRNNLSNPLATDRHHVEPSEQRNLRIHVPPGALTGFRRSYSRSVDTFRFRRWFRKTFAGRDFSRTVVLTMLPTWWEGYLSRDWLKPAMLIHDIFDDLDVLSSTPRTRAALLKAEQRMLPEIDLLTCSAHTLVAQINARFPSKPVTVLPNAVAETFPSFAGGQAPEPTDAAGDAGGPMGVGFLGTLEPKWFDAGLVLHLARELTGETFHLIGPVEEGVRRELEQCANVRLHGMRVVPDALEILKNCRVAIIPFLKNSITDVVNPLKLYEYTAAGLPVIATETEELRHYAAQVTLVDSRDKWVGAIRAATVPDEKTREALRSFAWSNTWTIRANALLQRIAELREGR